MRGELARDLSRRAGDAWKIIRGLYYGDEIDGEWRTGPMVVGARSSGRMRVFTSMINGGSSALRDHGSSWEIY